jgi:isopentenyl diphosphate isomerase/L-lactate dehydrogenase-like FMN-dependent dehydrogenase
MELVDPRVYSAVQHVDFVFEAHKIVLCQCVASNCLRRIRRSIEVMEYLSTATMRRLKEVGFDPKKNPKEVGAKWIDENIWHCKAHSWEKVPWLMEQPKRISGGRPFCLKGIQSVADAKKAVAMGVDE